MRCRVVDLRNKDVINIKNGCRIGFVCDAEIDTCTAQLVSIVVCQPCCFSFFSRQEDIVIDWCDIEVIGEDSILVKCRQDFFQRRKKSGFFRLLMGSE